MISRKLILFQLAIGIALFNIMTLAQGYDFNWDVLNYHFYNGFAAVHGKIWSNVQVSMRQSYFCPWMDVLFYALVMTMPPIGVALVLATIQALAYPLTFTLAAVLLGPVFQSQKQAFSIATSLALLSALAPVNILEVGGAYGDTTSGVLVIASLLALVLATTMADDRRFWACIGGSGLLIGSATALKLTNAPFAVGIGFAMAVGAISGPQSAGKASPLRTILVGWCSIVAAFTLLYGPWAMALMTHFHNPFFPSFNQIFRSGYAAASSFTDPAFALPSLADKLLFPFRRNPIAVHNDGAGLFDLRLTLAVPLAIIAAISIVLHSIQSKRWRMHASAATVLTFFLVSYFSWLWVFAINRYAVSLELLAPLVCVLGIAMLTTQKQALWAGAVVSGLLFLGSASMARDLILRPFDRRSDGSGGYFGVRMDPLVQLPHGGMVVLLGDEATAFVIPYFPRDMSFVRLSGSMYYVDPQYANFAHGSTHGQRRQVFGNELGALICKRLDDSHASILTLRPAGGPTPADFAAMKFYGLTENPAQCQEIHTKAAFDMWLCPAERTPIRECDEARD